MGKNISKGKSQNTNRKLKTQKRLSWIVAAHALPLPFALCLLTCSFPSALPFAFCALPFDLFFSLGFALCLLRFAF
jgi:hypothetical protein